MNRAEPCSTLGLAETNRRLLDLPARKKTGPLLRTQVTLRKRNALAVQRLAEVSGKTQAATVEWMVDQWLNGEGRQALLDSYDIDISAFQERSKVVTFRERDGGAS